MDPANASYLPSLFDHSHAKSVKTRITQTSRNAGSQVDDVPKVKRKSAGKSTERTSECLIRLNRLIAFVARNRISYLFIIINFK